MINRGMKRRRLVGIFLLGLVLCSYPVLSVFNRQITVFGLPLLYLYLFSAWALLIVLIILTTWAGLRDDRSAPPRNNGSRR